MATERARHPEPALISVVIPVRNAAGTLPEQLAALAAQTYAGAWEIVLADNGSTDDTVEVARSFDHPVAPLRVVDACARAGSSYARNHGAENARGDFIAFCDADDVVAPGWLDALARAARDYDAVTGPQDASSINSAPVQQWRPPRATALPRSAFLPYAPSCNLAVWADVYACTGGFDEAYPQAHDVEWSWRAQLAGFTLGFAPDAVVNYRYRATVRGVARQAYLSGIDSARLYRDFRSRGMKRPRLARSLRVWAWLVARLPYLVSPAQRGVWVRRAGEAWGRARGSARFRVVFL
jgi:glycosyltransferase involved in cell wall biosynthesis